MYLTSLLGLAYMGLEHSNTDMSEQLLFSWQVLLACKGMAESLAREKVVGALHALCHHTWPPAVRGTAAAIAMESAQTVCGNVFITEVPLLDWQCKRQRGSKA